MQHTDSLARAPGAGLALPETASTRFDPDRQMPLPTADAVAYAQRVMQWSGAPALAPLLRASAVAYGAHRLQHYDVFAPEGAADAPVLVFWHGGGWTNGYREYAHFMAPHVTRRGFVFVTPSYRLAPEHQLPCAFDDSLAALDHLAQHLPRWGGSPRRLCLAGHSAGGHLAALASLRAPDTAAYAVRACLPISAILDLQHPAPPPGSLEERVYTMVLGTPELDAAMSPLCWTRGNRVPFALHCGDADSERVRRSNQRMAQLLALQPAPATLTVRAGQDHFATHTALQNAGHAWYQQLALLEEDTRP